MDNQHPIQHCESMERANFNSKVDSNVASCPILTELLPSYLTGSGTFLLLTYQTLKWGGTQHFRQTVQSGMVGVWALR